MSFNPTSGVSHSTTMTTTPPTSTVQGSPARYVPATSQLVLEIYTTDILSSLAFWTSLGFSIVNQGDFFASLLYEDTQLYIERPTKHEITQRLPSKGVLAANVRLMVPDVNAKYDKFVKEMGLEVIVDIDDRYYGLRDFTIQGPDGIAVRVGTYLGDLIKKKVQKS
ncbi:hypothetical protein BC937DRAFT_91121 [Endogone sp. FLAS-F59071]|nr:hypothetical protein BC937DRAFT_91121 [Endogone sp. FLAS-F59071]|eukprot:RUS21899.1 hypothetical protein BC937DRAFT_91121 [Endogone sp. FLAS-F59071]